MFSISLDSSHIYFNYILGAGWGTSCCPKQRSLSTSRSCSCVQEMDQQFGASSEVLRTVVVKRDLSWKAKLPHPEPTVSDGQSDT